MGETTESAPFTKEHILDLRFPYKLWILINMPNQILTWGEEGTSIFLDYVALNLYLTSAGSFFKLKTGYKFLRQLTVHGFEQVKGSAETPGNVILEFKHDSFIRGREDLVGQIHREGSLQKQKPKRKYQVSFGLTQGQRSSDPCLSKVRPLAAIERARLNLRVLLQMQNENFTLNKKLSECERKSPSSAVSVIELPADAFENPFDSISQFEENSEYAGYYGSASTEQIKQFFDEYLPVYAQSNDDANEKSANQASQKESQPKQYSTAPNFSFAVPGEQPEETRADPSGNPPNFQIKYSVNLDTASDNKEYTLNILEETVSRIASSGIGSDATMSSFPECEDTNDTSGRDEDISMDEYLKFKDNPTKDEGYDDGAEAERDVKPEMAGLKELSSNGAALNNEDVKEDVDDEGGESNFKNFFNQYRESINLLYE